jgi:diphthamide synthase subunit DPH2
VFIVSNEITRLANRLVPLQAPAAAYLDITTIQLQLQQYAVSDTVSVVISQKVTHGECVVHRIGGECDF